MSSKNIYRQSRFQRVSTLNQISKLVAVVLGVLSSITVGLHVQAATSTNRVLVGTPLEHCVLSDMGEVCDNTLTTVQVAVSYGLRAKLEAQTSGDSEPVVVEVRKTPPSLTYPLKYFHSVQYRLPSTEEELESTDEDPLFYDGYEIGEYSANFEVEVELGVGGNSEQIILSPSQRIGSQAIGTTFSLTAELIGDYVQYGSPLELDNYILYIPSYPTTHAYVQNYPENMMLLPREEVTKDGSECNKVGVSPRSDAICLVGASLYDRHQQDLMQLAVNQSLDTTYLVKYMRRFSGMNFQSSQMPKALVYKVREIVHSTVSLTMDDSEISSIVQESQGAIWSATVETFESLTGDGVLEVLIRNNGPYEADYVVSVNDCSSEVSPIPAQARSTPPIRFRVEVLFFDIHVEQDIDTTHQCTVTLSSPTGRIYDTYDVVFDSNRHTKAEFDPDKDGVVTVCLSSESCDSPPQALDNCPRTFNPDQEDTNGDGVGDACTVAIQEDSCKKSKKSCKSKKSKKSKKSGKSNKSDEQAAT